MKRQHCCGTHDFYHSVRLIDVRSKSHLKAVSKQHIIDGNGYIQNSYFTILVRQHYKYLLRIAEIDAMQHIRSDFCIQIEKVTSQLLPWCNIVQMTKLFNTFRQLHTLYMTDSFLFVSCCTLFPIVKISSCLVMAVRSWSRYREMKGNFSFSQW